MIIKVAKHILDVINNTISFKHLRLKYKKMNKHNSTTLLCDTDINQIKVGNYTYGGINVLNLNGVDCLKIGSFCSIAHDVTFVVCADHDYHHISTYPFKAKILHSEKESIGKGDIIVDDDVWIGFGATILSGVHIGQGAVIASNAIISRDVPPYAIVAGNPGKVVKYRFDQETIDKLLSIDFSSIDSNFIKNNVELLYSNAEFIDVSKFPKKKEI